MVWDNGSMRSRSFIAFMVGVSIFAVVPSFVTELPARQAGAFLVLLPELLMLGGGAAVVLIAGRWQAWWFAPASALPGSLLWSIYFEIALEPLRRDVFEVGSVAIRALDTFIESGSVATLGAVLAGAALGRAAKDLLSS